MEEEEIKNAPEEFSEPHNHVSPDLQEGSGQEDQGDPFIQVRGAHEVNFQRTSEKTPENILGWILYVLQRISEFVIAWRKKKEE